MFWIISGVLLVFLLVVLWLGYSRAALARRVRAALAREVGLPARADPADLSSARSPGGSVGTGPLSSSVRSGTWARDCGCTA